MYITYNITNNELIKHLSLIRHLITSYYYDNKRIV